MPPIGVSFVPGQDSGQQENQLPGGAASGLPPIQQAIQLLSLRLPRVGGVNAPVNNSLLTGPGSGGLSLPQILQMLFGVGPNGQPGSGGPSGGGAGGGANSAMASAVPGPHWTVSDPPPGGGGGGVPPPNLPTWGGPQTPQEDRSQPGAPSTPTFGQNPWSVRGRY